LAQPSEVRALALDTSETRREIEALCCYDNSPKTIAIAYFR
jgi:hypothetical protein